MDNSKTKNLPDPINVLRVIACFIVLILHSLISTQKAGFDLYSYKESQPWVFLLKTPAWAGVWIFFILSAYLAGRGFFTGKYKYSVRGFLQYYLKKVVRIIIPVYAFILLVCTIVFPHFLHDNPIAIYRLFFFRYTGDPGIAGVGSLWYISTVMPVYILAPFVCLLLDKTLGTLCKKRPAIGKTVAVLLLLLVAFIGYNNRINLLENGASWYNDVYVSFYTNIDLFLGGFLLNFITLKDSPQTKNTKLGRVIVKIVASLLIAAVIAVSCYLYFVGERYDIAFLDVYRYKFPTVFLIAVCLYLFAFDYEKAEKQAPLNWKNVAKNPTRILDFLSDISFEIYIFHTLIYEQNWPVLAPIDTMWQHIGFTLLGFLLSCAFGYAFHKAFLPKPKKKRLESASVDTNTQS